VLWNGNKCEKKVMEISRKPLSVQILIDQKTTGELGMF
jgi:hypothetical protein